MLTAKGQYDEATINHQRAVELVDYAIAHNNLGITLMFCGSLDRAMESLRRALALLPDNPVFHSNILTTMNYHPSSDRNIFSRSLAIEVQVRGSVVGRC